MSHPSGRPTRRPLPAVLLTVVVLALLGLAGLSSARTLPPPPHGQLPWPVLLGLIVVVEASVVHVQVRREAQTLSMSELPLVLGLFLWSPTTLVGCRVVGSALVYLLVRRQAPLKLAFNTAVSLAEVGTALAVFSAVRGDAASSTPHAWAAAWAAVVCAAALSAVAVRWVIYLYEGELRLRDLRASLEAGVPIALLTATLGLIATTCLLLSTATAWLLAPAALLGTAAYRGYARLLERHRSVDRLYRFSQVVSGRADVDDVVGAVLAQALQLLHAERAELVLVSPDDDVPGVRLWWDGERLHTDDAEELQAGAWLRRDVVDTGTARLVTVRRGAPPEHVDYLQARGMREAVAVPLRGQGGVVGALVVADRQGSVRRFGPGDVELVETVANHASVALENGRLVDRLRHDAMHDSLTGLPNRARLEAELVAELTATRARGAGTALLLMDLDGFKEVNDTLGHLHGDLLLREVGQRLAATAPPGALVVRLGGDEFAVLLPGEGDVEVAMAVGWALRAALEAPATLEDVRLEVGGSIGVALAPLHGSDPHALLKCADVAMYAAKSTGRGVLLYQSSLDGVEPAKLVLASELRAALADDQLQVHAQPQARLSDGEVVGVELLVRWQHPQRGLVPPDEFIPVAERTGLLRAVTATVLGEGIAAAAAWRAAGRRLQVAVNLSTRSLLDPDLVDDVLSVLALHRLPAEQLTLEITEGSVMTDLEGSTAVLERLRAAGVRLSVDDFGTGYSSLSYLSRLPVDEVKIDKHFVLGLTADEQDAAIVRSVIDLGANLGLEVVAEGVEDRATWDQLAALGCGVAQGWHLGHPMPLHDVPPWLAQREAARRHAVPDQRLAPLTTG